MRSSFELGRIFGIRVRIHWLFIALLVYLLLFGGGLASVVLVTCVFGFVVLHELGHSLVARHYGVGVRDITLLPIGGVARLEGMAPSPRAELLIAIAGPLVNIAFALVLFPLAVLAGAGQVMLGANVLGSLAFLLSALVSINLGLALFNLLPAFPMDGGRILRAWLTRRYGMVEATRKAARVGRWMAALMAVAGVVFLRPMLLLIAVFVYFAGSREEMAVRLRHAQAPTLEFDPLVGWHYRAPRGFRTTQEGFDHHHVAEAFDRLMRGFRR